MTDMNTLQGNTALITGAAKRVGREIALALARRGVHIVLHYNSSLTEAERIAAEIKSCGVNCWTIQEDFGKTEKSRLIHAALGAAGSLNYLINSASIFETDTLHDVEWTAVERHMRINAWAAFVLSRDFFELARHGQIINVLDTRIHTYDWSHVSYILSKHLLAVLTQMTAKEFAPSVQVNAIAPGLILAPEGKGPEHLDKLAQGVPLRKHGSPEKVAQAAIYLLENDFITGQIINVDGGEHLNR